MMVWKIEKWMSHAEVLLRLKCHCGKVSSFKRQFVQCISYFRITSLKMGKKDSSMKLSKNQNSINLWMDLVWRLVATNHLAYVQFFSSCSIALVVGWFIWNFLSEKCDWFWNASHSDKVIHRIIGSVGAMIWSASLKWQWQTVKEFDHHRIAMVSS